MDVYLDGQSVAANKDSCYTAATPTVTFGGSITGDVQAVVNANWGAYTVGLSTMDSGGNGESTQERWKKFFPDTAKLTVQYNHAPKTPVMADLTVAPAQACGPAPIYLNASNGVTLRAMLSDPDGDNVTAQWSVTGIAAAYAPADTAAATAGLFKTTIPAAAFTGGSTYSWTLRGTDGTDTGGYGPNCSFIVDNALPGIPVVTSTDLNMVYDEPAPEASEAAVVGRTAAVTLAPAAGTTTSGYLIGVGVGAPVAPSVWIPVRSNGPTTASVVPVTAGDAVNYLTVAARSMAGQTGSVITYVFKAKDGGTPTRAANDATGDGRADLTVLSDVGDGRSALWRWGAANDGGLAPVVAPQDVTSTFPTAATKWTQGDFDGDGLADIATFSQVGADVVLSVQRSEGNALRGVELTTLAGWSIANMRVLAANVDGDAGKRDDIIVFYDHGGYVFTERVFIANGTPGTPTFAAVATWFTQPASGGALLGNMQVLAGNFDGDAYGDVAFLYNYGSCQTKIWVQYSTGSAFNFGSLLWDSGVNNWCWDRTKPTVGDLDGDGAADIAATYTYDGCETHLWTFYGGANRTLSAPAVQWSSGPAGWCGNAVEPYAGDYNGDKKADVGVVYHCCGNYQVKVYTITSTGRAFNAPVHRWEGGIGPVGTGALVLAPGTRYQIININSGKCLAVMGGDQTQLTQQTCTTAGNMTFTFERSVGHLHLIHPTQAPTSCLDIMGYSMVNNAGLQQYPCHGQGNQRFQVTYLGGVKEPVVSFTVEMSGLNIDVPGSALGDGALIQQYTPNNTSAQQFTVRAVA